MYYLLLFTVIFVMQTHVDITLYVHCFYFLYFDPFYKSYVLVNIDSFRNHKVLDIW
jgi:hypothetical protein